MTTTELKRVGSIPAACRSLQDQIDTNQQLVAKLERLVETAPESKKPIFVARLRAANQGLEGLHLQLARCVKENDPGEPLPPVTMPKADIDREVFLAIATTVDAESEIVAGVLSRLVEARPNLPAARLGAAVETVAAAIAEHRPDPAIDLSPNEAFRMTQILAAVVPQLTDTTVRQAAVDYTQTLLGSFRVGTPLHRQVQPLDLQFDRLASVDQFRRDVWQRLYQAAGGRPAVATAINSGPLGVALGVATTDDAKAAVAKVQIPTLRKLVNDHVKPNGSLVMPSGEVETVLSQLAGDVGVLRGDYTTNLININIAIGKTEQDKSPAQQTELEKAIAKAEAKQEELDKILKKAMSGVKGSFGVLAAIVELADAEFAGDIREFAGITVGILDAIATAADAGIEVAKAVEGLLSATKNELIKYGGYGFAIGMTALLIQATGLFKSRTKPINQIILEEVRKLSEQVADLREAMHARFEQLDRRLDAVFDAIMAKLDLIDFNVGQIDGNVEEIQTALYELHVRLVRFTAEVQELLDAKGRRDLVQAINGSLNFAERTGQPIGDDDFGDAENLFYSWGNNHAKDPLQAGGEQRDFSADGLLDELSSASASTNVNYLRLVPEELFGLPPLAASRLANPLDWIVAAEAYAQLSEESPQLAEQFAETRIEDLIGVGEALGDGLSRIADRQLFAGVAEHYRTALSDVSTAITDFEAEFRLDGDNGLFGIDMWGGAEQRPTSNFFTTRFRDVGRCGGGRFDDDNITLSTGELGNLDRDALIPFLIADNLSRSKLPGVGAGLEELSACVQALWRQTNFEDPGLGGLVFISYKLSIVVNVNYGDARVYTYRVDTSEGLRAGVPRDEAGTFDPSTDRRGKNPYPLLVGDKDWWSKVSNLSATQGFVNGTVLPAMVAVVEDKLRAVQRQFYGQVAARFGEEGDPIARAGARLSGAKLLWQQLIVSGLPLSLQANEILRSLLFGGIAILGGRSASQFDGVLDDVPDLYLLFSGRPEDPPSAHILAEIEELANERLDRLAELVDGIIERQLPTEPPQVLAPTLLRLGLLL